MTALLRIGSAALSTLTLDLSGSALSVSGVGSVEAVSQSRNLREPLTFIAAPAKSAMEQEC